MKVEQFKCRRADVLVKVVFATSNIVMVPNPEGMKVLSRTVIAIGSEVASDLKVGMNVLLHQQPMMIIKMDFEDCPKDTMYALVTDRDVIGIVEPLKSTIIN